MHTLAVAVHAVAALLAAGLGFRALLHDRGATAYLVALVVSGLALVAAAATTTTAMVPVDLALLVLFAVVVARAVLARRVPATARRTSPRWITGIGFGLISLADAFVVVAVLDLGAPVVAVVASGVAVAVAGHLLLTRLLHRRATVGGGAAWVQRNRPPSRVGREV